MSAQQHTATNVNRGLAWIGAASSLVGVLDLVAIVLILNTWISAEEYGIATKCIWVFPILDQATDLGLSAAVIQRDDHDEVKISTVFWMNLMIAAALFAALVITAPILATHFYHHAIVGWMLIAYGTKLLWQNVYFIPAAMLKRELRFKELSVIRILANLAEFFGKIGFAWAGFGIWCFVLGPLCRVLVTGVGCQLRHPYKPKLVFRFKQAKDYVSFGIKTSASQILFYFYTNVDYPIVGFFFGDKALGLYRFAYDVALDPVRMISNVVVDIAFPTFARLRHERDRLIAQFVSFVRLNLITVMAFSAIVFVAADDLISVVFPDFVGAGTALRILCIVAVLRSVSFVVPPLLDGIGRPDRTFTYTLTAAVALPISYVLFAWLLGGTFGFESVAIAWSVGYPIAFAVLILLAVYTMKWRAGMFLSAVRGVALCMVTAGAVAWGVHALMGGVPPWLRLITTVVVVILVAALLLAYTQGLSLRTASRAMKGEPTPELEPTPEQTNPGLPQQ